MQRYEDDIQLERYDVRTVSSRDRIRECEKVEAEGCEITVRVLYQDQQSIRNRVQIECLLKRRT